jgi:hypothetical protein
MSGTAPLPADIATLDDYERHAATRLDPATWAHIQQGQHRPTASRWRAGAWCRARCARSMAAARR